MLDGCLLSVRQNSPTSNASMPLLLLYKKMVEYHDILWDIATAKNSGVSDVEVLYKYAPPISSFFNWRDSRVMDEISWYGWFIGKFMNPM